MIGLPVRQQDGAAALDLLDELDAPWITALIDEAEAAIGRPWAELLERIATTRPFMLSGGLHAGNVAEALAITRAAGVDVSSGVESAPGVKDPERIRAFIRTARQAAERLAAEPVRQLSPASAS